MSDKFIKKANDSKDFNNGGIVYNATGGGDDFPNGPENNLSESNQQKKLMNLKKHLHPSPFLPPYYRTWEEYWATEPDLGPSATVNNHGQVDSGGYGIAYGTGDFNTNNGPCPDGSSRNKETGCCGAQTKASLTLENFFRKTWTYDNDRNFAQQDAQKFLDHMQDETSLAESPPVFPAGYLLWVIHAALTRGRDAKCDCWKPLIGVSDLFGGMIARKAALKMLYLSKGASGFTKYFGRSIRSEMARKGYTIQKGMSDAELRQWAKDCMNSNKKTIKVAVEKIGGGTITFDVNMFDQLNHVFYQLFGVSIITFMSLSLMVPKRCYGSNAVLNWKTCECECPPDHFECTATKLGGNVDASWLYDLIAPNFAPTANELKACRHCDCDLKVGDSVTSVIVYGGWNTCMCDSCIDGTTFKAGVGCSCYKEFNRPPLPGGVTPGDYTPGIGKQRGKCVDNQIIAVETALGKSWDGEKCAYTCPPGSHIADGDSPIIDPSMTPSCSRLEDNLYSMEFGMSGTAPSKHHYLYRTGCNYVCDERAISENCDPFPNGSAHHFPPTCFSGYVWNGDPLVCACVNTGACAAKHQTNGGSEGGVSDNPCGGAPDCYNNKTQQECDAIAAEQGRTFTFHIGETCTGCCNEYFFSGVAAGPSTPSGCDTSSAGYGGVFSQQCCWDGGANPDDFTCCGDPQCSSDYQSGCDECGQPDC